MLLSLMMATTWRCGGESGPPTSSCSSSAPSRSAVSGVFSSCDRWRRKRFFCASSSARRRRSQSSRSPSVFRSSGPLTAIGCAKSALPSWRMAASSSRDRARDVAREGERDGQRQRRAEQHQQHQLALHRFGVGAQARHLAVGDPRADGEHFVGVFRQLGGQRRRPCARSDALGASTSTW